MPLGSIMCLPNTLKASKSVTIDSSSSAIQPTVIDWPFLALKSGVPVNGLSQGLGWEYSTCQ